ncbi:hypothetical protein [uncultured Hoeflea sp.]|uniref:hypothetical protein n=1 Tax=uncultured Hoeflea sp. TaxID=538666 RepID=UPI00260F0484|nr:hypothetical protein [uncultured Hoeflea sp.]
MPGRLGTPFSAGAMRLAVLQIVHFWQDARATWDKVQQMARQAISDGAEVLSLEILSPNQAGTVQM